MRQRYSSLIARVTFMIVVLFQLSTQNSRAQSSPEFSVEVDPATFAFNGYAAHVRFRPANVEALKSWVIGVGVYSMKFPDPFRDLALDGASGPLTLKLKTGYGLFLDRSLSSDGNQGFFVGVQMAYHQYDVTNDDGVQSGYRSALIMGRAGYRWNIGNSGFYLLPWGGLGYVTKLDGDAGANVEVRHWLPFGTLHVGYTF